MSIGVFTDKRHQPTNDEILEIVGHRFSKWQELVCFIRKKYSVQEDLKFLYGKNYGWGLRFRIKGKLLVSLYPMQGGFTAQVNLRPEAIEKVQNMKVGKNVQKAIANAKPYPEGRWLFIPVESEKDIQDIQILLALRVEKK